MKPSFKLLVGIVSAMSLVAGTGYSASAQTSSVDSVGNQTPGSSAPATERTGTAPGTTNDPSTRQQPGSTSRDGSSAPVTERTGTAPGTTNDPSTRQQGNTSGSDGMAPATERLGTTPGTTNDPSTRQQPGSTSRDGSSAPATERLGTTPGTTNDPSTLQQPGSTSRDGSSTPSTERMGTTPGTTNDPSSRQQPGSTSRDSGMAPSTERMGTTPGTTNDPSGSQRMMPQAQIEAPDSASSMSINAIVDESPSFELFNALLRVANIEDEGLVEMLDGEDSYVVYAPTDEAFAALPPDTIRTLVQPENRDLLVDLLSYHIVPENDAMSGVQASTDGRASDNAESAAAPVGEVDSPSQLSDSTSSLNTGSSEFPTMRTDRASGGMMINDARVIGTNIEASNGVIYPIDRVILPSEVQSELGELGLIPSTGTPSAITPGSNAPSQRPF